MAERPAQQVNPLDAGQQINNAQDLGVRITCIRLPSGVEIVLITSEPRDE